MTLQRNDYGYRGTGPLLFEDGQVLEAGGNVENLRAAVLDQPDPLNPSAPPCHSWHERDRRAPILLSARTKRGRHLFGQVMTTTAARRFAADLVALADELDGAYNHARRHVEAGALTARPIYSAPVIGGRCNEPLLGADGYRARCSVRAYTEHSHHDHTAREAVEAGRATLGECVTRAHHSRDSHKAVCLDGWAQDA